MPSVYHHNEPQGIVVKAIVRQNGLCIQGTVQQQEDMDVHLNGRGLQKGNDNYYLHNIIKLCHDDQKCVGGIIYLIGRFLSSDWLKERA